MDKVDKGVFGFFSCFGVGEWEPDHGIFFIDRSKIRGSVVFLFVCYCYGTLHVIMEDAVLQGLFRGAVIGEDGLTLSHLFLCG